MGGAFSVRSGIMALGLESMMMMGAFFGVLGSYFTGSVLFGFLLGMVGGMVIGLFHGILSVRYKVNQVISGIGLNLLALAVTTLLMQLIWSNKGSTPRWPPSPPLWTSLLPSPSSAPFWPSSPSASL